MIRKLTFPLFHLAILLALSIICSLSVSAQEDSKFIRLKKENYPDSALHLIDQQLSVPGLKSESKRLLWVDQSDILFDQENYPKVLLVVDALLSEKKILDPKVITTLFRRKYLALLKLGKDQEAVETLFEARNYTNTLPDKIHSAKINQLIGVFFSIRKDYSRSKIYTIKALEIYKDKSDSIGISRTMMTLGNSYKNNNELDSALFLYKKSLSIATRADFKKGMAGNYNNIANILRKQNQEEKAIDYFKKAVKINLLDGNRRWESFNYNNIGNTYSSLGEINKAIEFFYKSIAVKKEINEVRSLQETYLNISDEYIKVKDYKNAYYYLELHTNIKDSLEKVDQANEIAALEAKYRFQIPLNSTNKNSPDTMISEGKSVTSLNTNVEDQLNDFLKILLAIAGVILVTLTFLLISKNKRS